MAVKIAVVTGAAGFVGTEVTKQLLDRGYTVRATLRKATPENSDFLKALGAALPGKLEIVEGADLTVEGTFDKAVEGATYVFHVASPATFGSGDPVKDQAEVVDPAVNGTLSVLKAAAKAKTVERVVITSSVAALHGFEEAPGKIYTPDSWNTLSTLETQAYPFSKTQAEKAAWKFSKEHGIDVVTILPSVTIGPAVSTRGGSSVDLVRQLLEGKPFSEVLPMKQFVDVRDVARAHILAAEIASANGRYILSHPTAINFKDLYTALQREFPSIDFAATDNTEVRTVYDTSKAVEDLGLELIPATTSFVDEARTLLALGYGKPVYKL